MSQIIYRARLISELFPLVSTFQGQTIIQSRIDNHQNYIGRVTTDQGVPEVYYLHNVMPDRAGWKSIDYTKVIDSISDSFTQILTVKDFDGNRALLGITDTGKTYMLTRDNPEWVNVTPAGQPVESVVTVASVTGSSFICYANFGIFEVNITDVELTLADLEFDSPVTSADMVGISSSNNYLLAHDGTTLYWSSALSVLDFKASLITGAGNGVPTASIGAIVGIAPVGVGFAIYCTGNIVVATFSGNVQYPWLFKEAPNGSGIESINAISFTGDDNSNYIWCSAGILKVTLAGCAPVFPEVADFLAGRLIEEFDTFTNTLSRQVLSRDMLVRISFLSSRYLCISYGITSLSYILVYDIALNRWGKLKFDHIQVIDLPFGLKSNLSGLTYDDAEIADYTYSDFSSISFDDINPYTSVIASAKHSLAVISSNGATHILNFDYANVNADAVIILGKYQIVREKRVSLVEIDVETIDSANNNFLLRVLTSYSGKDQDIVITPHETEYDDLRNYKLVSNGLNHSILIKGSFHLVGIIMAFLADGNR